MHWRFLASRYLPELISLALVLVAQGASTLWILRGPAAKAPQWLRRAIGVCAAASMTLITFASLLRYYRVAHHFPRWFATWGRGIAITWALWSVLLVAAFAVSRMVLRRRPDFSPSRRRFLGLAHTAVFGAPAAVIGYGVFIERFRLRLREETIAIPGLPADLHGLRIVQLTDIHLSPFLTVEELDRAIDMANETRAHLGLVTGDLITTRGDPLDACLVRLARLRADAGIFGCMGNHEYYANAEDYATERGAQLGLRFLRSEAAPLRFGGAILNLAGVDYQTFREPYLLGAERLVRPGAFNVLLSHNPDVFPVAARQGYDLTIAGHTHGGQVRVEILRQDLNIARFFTPYVDGLYQRGSSSIFVSRGIGTIALPVRLGAPPEVALLRLCRT